jgi:hypothetical protein
MFSKIGWPNLDEDVCIKIFFMVLNNNFLTPNTYYYIRPVDALWCRDMKSIASYNWCKIICQAERSMQQVEGGSTSQNRQANYNGLFTISHGTNHCNSNSFPFAVVQRSNLYILVHPMIDFVPRPPQTS